MKNVPEHVRTTRTTVSEYIREHALGLLISSLLLLLSLLGAGAVDSLQHDIRSLEKSENDTLQRLARLETKIDYVLESNGAMHQHTHTDEGTDVSE